MSKIGGYFLKMNGLRDVDSILVNEISNVTIVY